MNSVTSSTDNEKNSATEITTDDEKIFVDKTWDCAVRYDPRDTIAQQQKTIDRQHAEIERLKILHDHSKKIIQRLKKRILATKSEAVKECLDKIEQFDVSESDNYIMVKKNEFYNLVKEMVG